MNNSLTPPHLEPFPREDRYIVELPGYFEVLLDQTPTHPKLNCEIVDVSVGGLKVSCPSLPIDIFDTLNTQGSYARIIFTEPYDKKIVEISVRLVWFRYETPKDATLDIPCLIAFKLRDGDNPLKAYADFLRRTAAECATKT